MSPDKKPLSLIQFDKGETVALGMMWEDHADDCPNRAARFMVDECDCENLGFSHGACQGCGDPAAGDRHAMTIFYS